jgi:hypothetical protein
MPLVVDPDRSHVVVETTAKGLLAKLAHDLRIEARGAEGRALSDTEVRVSFPVDKMTVVESRRHGSGPFGPPPASDRPTIEQKIRDEVFPGTRAIEVTAHVDGARATIDVETARGKQTISTSAAVSRDGAEVRASGTTRLSLEALRAGQPHVPMGAIKLEDAVDVRFEIVLVER